MACLLCLSLASVAAADTRSSRRFESRFVPVASDCESPHVTLTKGLVQVIQKGPRVEVAVPALPALTGTIDRRGKINARSKLWQTPTSGIAGHFSFVGRASGNRLQVVLVAEFFAGKNAICSQSWSVTGLQR